MFHFLHGKVQKIWSESLIISNNFGIQALYTGNQKEWDFFLYPYMDENRKSVFYFAFDTREQKSNFKQMLKISGVWPKTAFQICQLPTGELKAAIETLDAKFFQQIPGIWPKLAKKIILELKGTFDLQQAESIDTKHKIFKSVVKTLKNLGYDATKVQEVLRTYEGNLDQADLSEVVKWTISRL